MWADRADVTLNGLFLPSCGVTMFPGPIADLARARDKFIIKSHDGAVESLSPAFCDCSSLDEIKPLLTRRHELSHYTQLTSTSFGLLLWQVEVVLNELMLAHPQGSEQDWITSSEIGHAVEAVQLFDDALHSDLQVSIQQFLQIANTGHYYVARYWGLPRREWVSRSADLSTSYLSATPFSTLEIVEAQARMAEYSFMEAGCAQIPRHLVEEWEKTSLHGPYRPVTKWLVDTIGSSQTSLLLCDEALSGWGCLAVQSGETPIVVEDVLPTWRLQDLARVARESILPVDPAQQSAWFYSAMHRQQSEVTKADLDPQGLLDYEEEGFPLDYKYRSWLLQRFVRGLALRGSGIRPSVVNSVEGAQTIQKGGGFQPLAEFYSDCVLFNTDILSSSPDLLLRCFGEIVYSAICVAVQSRTLDLSHLRIFERGVADLTGEDLSGLGMDVHGLLAYLVGDDRAAYFLL